MTGPSVCICVDTVDFITAYLRMLPVVVTRIIYKCTIHFLKGYFREHCVVLRMHCSLVAYCARPIYHSNFSHFCRQVSLRVLHERWKYLWARNSTDNFA